MILLVAGIYLTVWVAIVIFSYNKTLKATQSKKQAFAVSAFFFLVMYLIPFWDLIPTLVAHKYYCDAQAGVVVHKTPEQWRIENPGVLNTLKPYEKSEMIDSQFGRVSKSNDRFGSVVSVEKVGSFPVRKSYFAIIDIINEEIIYEKIDFVRGYGQFNVGANGWWKFWLYKNSCFSYEDAREFGKTSESFVKKLRME